jgi:TfoX/Sxy family transcriptional regulator of competence genes
MAFNEKLNDKIREAMAHLPKVEEKYMFGGSCFMLNGKMCVGVVKDEMTCLPPRGPV